MRRGTRARVLALRAALRAGDQSLNKGPMVHVCRQVEWTRKRGCKLNAECTELRAETAATASDYLCHYAMCSRQCSVIADVAEKTQELLLERSAPKDMSIRLQVTRRVAFATAAATRGRR